MAATRRAIIYGRLSGSADGVGVDTQIDEGQRVAEREGWSVLGVYRDDGISASRYAKSKKRAGWRQVMDVIATDLRSDDVLIVREISRASRDRQVYAALIAAAIESSVLICVHGKLHDPADPDDGFMLDLTSSLAVRESAVTARRVKLAVDARAARGLPHGRIAYGYRRIYSEATGKPDRLEPDPDTAPIVREIAQRVLAGESLGVITADLNRRGVPSPLTVTMRRNWRPTVETPWKLHHVRRIARSATAAGVRVATGVVRHDIDVTWEPLVSRADHARLLQLDEARQKIGQNDNQTRHLLTYLATCGPCGNQLVAGKNNNSPSYFCRSGHVSRNRAQLDRFVVTAVLTYLQRPVVTTAIATSDDDAERDINRARDEVVQLRAQLDEWYAAAVSGDVSPAGLTRIEAGLLERLADAERRSMPRAASPAIRALATPTPEPIKTRWDALTIGARREIVRELVTVAVHPQRRGRVLLDPESVIIEFR